jgi:hypothetical protein
MRFLLVFFCLFLITACQDNPAPDSDYEDDFLLVAHQTMTPLDDDYSQDMNLKALVRNRIADGPDDGPGSAPPCPGCAWAAASWIPATWTGSASAPNR